VVLGAQIADAIVVPGHQIGDEVLCTLVVKFCLGVGTGSDKDAAQLLGNAQVEALITHSGSERLDQTVELPEDQLALLLGILVGLFQGLKLHHGSLVAMTQLLSLIFERLVHRSISVVHLFTSLGKRYNL